jgi:hypothetical protein
MGCRGRYAAVPLRLTLEESTTDAVTDIIVMGTGAAGLAAAITAHDAGARVVILEKMSAERAGGNSRVSGQVWFCPKDADTARTHLHAMARDYIVPDDVVTALATESARHTEWILARVDEVRGRVPRDDGDPYDGDPAEVTRVSIGAMAGGPPGDEYPEIAGNECGTEYNFLGGSMGFSRLWLTLMTCVAERGIPIRYESEGQALVRDADGHVTGVEVRGPDGEISDVVARRGVILASGGFAANPVMTRNYLRLPAVTPWGSPANTGDGIRMAQKVGADLAHPYNYMAMPGIAMPPYPAGENALPQDHRFINVGADGRRFVNETLPTLHGKTRLGGDYDFFPGNAHWTIFDEDGRLAGPLVIPRQFFAVSWNKQIEGYDWSLDNQVEIAKGWITQADSLHALAEKLSIDHDGLEAEVTQWNEWVAAGTADPKFGRTVATMRPITRPPFYGYPWAQLLITTLGGIRKDERARAPSTPTATPFPVSIAQATSPPRARGYCRAGWALATHSPSGASPATTQRSAERSHRSRSR